MRRLASLLTASALIALGVVALPQAPAAHAATLPPGVAGDAGADILGLDVNLLSVPLLGLPGVQLAGVSVGQAESDFDGAAPSSSAASRNVGLTGLGLNLPIAGSEQSAPPDHASPATGRTLGVNAGVLDLGVLDSFAHARWAETCSAEGQSATAETDLAGAGLNLLGLDVLDLGVSQVTTQTSIEAAGMTSRASGNVAGLTLLNGTVSVTVIEPPALSAVATGDPATTTTEYAAPVVEVSVGGGPVVQLQPGAAIPLDLTLLGIGLRGSLSLGDVSSTIAADSSSATAAVSMLELDLAVAATLLDVGDISIDVLPLSVSATAPDLPVAQLCIDDPVITQPTDGSSGNDTTPTIAGTGEPEATIDVALNGASIGTATVGADGTWSLDATEPLADGTYTAVATQTIGGTVTASAPVAFTIDTVAPGAPVLIQPADGSVIADATPTVMGTGAAGATVTVSFDGTESGTVVVDAGGNWSYTPTEPLADGQRTVTVLQTDAAGNASPTDEHTFTIDTTALAPVIEAPVDGSATTDTTPTVSGTGEAGATVTVAIDGAEVGTAAVDEDGAWTLELTTPLGEGPHTVIATQTDAVGNVSPEASSTFTVDLTAPSAPTIAQPANGSVTGDATPTVSGTGEPGATVTVSIDGEEVGTADVTGGGTWSLELVEPLAEGVHTAAATQADAAGNVSPRSATNTFTVDLTAPEAPVIEAPADGSVTSSTTPTVAGTGEAGATVAVTIDGAEAGTALVGEDGTWSLELTEPLAEGEHTVEAIQTDPAGNASAADAVTFEVDTTAPAAPVIEAPAHGSVTGDATPAVTGTGEAGAAVTVTIDGEPAGTVAVTPEGAWTLDLIEPLAEGEHTVVATQADEAGNVSPESSSTFAVDLTAPDAPVIETPADGSITNDATPTVAGTGEVGATVTVAIDGTTVGTAPVVDGGTWSLDPSLPLPEGTHTATATQADAAGNVSDADSVTFTVDVTAPSAPVIDSPADGSVIGDATPTVAGTGEPGATVSLAIDGAPVGTAAVDARGAWSLDLTAPLAEGEHTATATQADAAGNVSPVASSAFEVDLTAPTAPVIEAPADGAVLSEATPTVSGTGEPGATVDVLVDGVAVGDVIVDDEGAWALELTDPLAEGEHTATATQTDAGGNVSEADTVTFAIDTTAPAAPVILAPADGSTTGDPTPTVSGTGEPGSTVSVAIDGADVGAAPVGEDGAWSLELTTPLAEGEHTVEATQTDPAGNGSPRASSTFAVDLTAPAAPVIEAPADGALISDATPTVAGTGEAGATVTVVVDGAEVGTAPVDEDGAWSLDLTTPLADGEHTIEATQTDAGGNVSEADAVTFAVDSTAPAAPAIAAPVEGAVTNDATPTIAGTGEAGATVAVAIDGADAGTARVDVDGSWSLELSTPLADGEHTVEATQADAAGNESEADSVTFVVDTAAPSAPVIESPADGSVTRDATPTVAGTGEPGATVRVVVDGIEAGTATVDEDATWSLDLTTPLADGEHTVQATQTDAAGNASASDSVTFVVDTVAPAAPSIDSPADGALLADPTPTVSGTGEPGAIVTVSVDGEAVGSAPVDADGTWSLELDAPLSDGEHTIEAIQVDEAGNASAPDVISIVIDTAAPEEPGIESPANGSATADPTPTVTGTGEPGATVTVTVDGVPVGTVVVGEDGSWSLELDEPLADGERTIGATQTDAAGNTSTETTVVVTIDTEIEAPVIEAPLDGELTADATPTVSGTGEPGATVTVTVDGEPVGTTVVDEDGRWSLELDEPLADGERTIGASQRDAAGNQSEPTVVTITIDTTAPAAPVIESPSDGDVIDDRTPTIVGTGEPGATIIVTIDGEPAGIVVVDADGGWSLELDSPLTDGHHDVAASQTDAAGNASAPASIRFEVRADVTAPPPGDGSGDDGSGDDGSGGDGSGDGEGPGAGAGSGGGGTGAGTGSGSLPRTGAEAAAPVVLLGLLLLLGGAALTRTRRRSA